MIQNSEQRQAGVSVATFTLAVNRTFKNAEGKQEADFLNCVVFRKQAENVNKYVSKGSQVGVDGRLQSRSYDNKEGNRVFVTEVVCDNVQFLETKGTQKQNGQQPKQSLSSQENPFANANGPIDISDDDLPF